MKIAHTSLVSILSIVWLVMAAILWPLSAYAASLSADVKVYDWLSLLAACGIGMLGGLGALIVALASDEKVVLHVTRDSLRNMIVSPIAGAAVYLLIEAMEDLNLTPGKRFFAIGFAGWAGIEFFVRGRKVALEWLDSVAKWIINRGAK